MITLTPAGRAALAAAREKHLAEAKRIVTGGDAYTESQRRLAWRVLSGMPPHPRAPQPQQPEPRGAA